MVLGQNEGSVRQQWDKLLYNDRQMQTTLGILGCKVCFCLILVLKANKKDFTIRKFHNKVKKAGSKPSFLGAFATCLRYI